MVYKANELAQEDDYIQAEMEYRRAISNAPNQAVGAYNLATTYYKKGNFNEALFRTQEAAKKAETKDEKHRAYHNIGNLLMKEKKCKEAMEAFKNALRNNPTDEETRYNFALAKECAEQQKDGGGEDDPQRSGPTRVSGTSAADAPAPAPDGPPRRGPPEREHGDRPLRLQQRARGPAETGGGCGASGRR